MTRASTSLAAYARAVEKLWTEFMDRPVILSPRDWSVIGDWHERGVPLQVIREAIDALAQRRRKTPPRGLWVLSASVNESFSAIAAGHLEEPPAQEVLDGPRVITRPTSETEPADAGGVAAWRRCLAQVAGDADPMGRLLIGLLAKHEAGVDSVQLDRALDEALADAVSPALLDEVTREVEAGLLDFRVRMPAAAFATTARRAVLDRLRSRLGLVRLARP